MFQRRRQRKLNALRKLQESIARRKSLQTSQKVGICRKQQATNDRSTPVSFPPMICARSRGSTTAREPNDGTRCVVKMRSRRYMEGFGKGFKSLAMLNYVEVKSNILPLCAIGFQMQSKAENSVCDVVKGKSFNWISSKWRSDARPRHWQVRSCLINEFLLQEEFFCGSQHDPRACQSLHPNVFVAETVTRSPSSGCWFQVPARSATMIVTWLSGWIWGIFVCFLRWTKYRICATQKERTGTNTTQVEANSRFNFPPFTQPLWFCRVVITWILRHQC